MISDDLRIRSKVIDINNYTKKYHNKKAPIKLTTSRLVYEMYKKQILTDKDKLMKIMSAFSTGNINVLCMGEEDIQLIKQSFTKEELLNKQFLLLSISTYKNKTINL